MTDRHRIKGGWHGRYVELTTNLVTNGGTAFHAGEVMLVDRRHNGLHLTSARRCSECRRHWRASVGHVQFTAVWLLPEDYDPDSDPRNDPENELKAENVRLHNQLHVLVRALNDASVPCPFCGEVGARHRDDCGLVVG